MPKKGNTKRYHKETGKYVKIVRKDPVQPTQKEIDEINKLLNIKEEKEQKGGRKITIRRKKTNRKTRNRRR